MGMTETAILKTAAHELTHFIQANSAQYEALKSFVVNKLTHEEGVSFEDLVADKQRREPGLEYDEAVDEVVADACEMMLGDSTVVEQLAKENRSLAEKIRDWLREWVENLKIALEGLQADRTESRAMMQYARELQEIWDNALMDAAKNNRGTVEAESRQQARVGTDAESGKPIYQSNFPKGTPKAAKAQRILSLIQNVWSKKPISLVAQDADGSTRRIEAKFDPTFDEGENTRTDASKMMVGNRHGSASEQRVTLDLADDYYEIAAESTYNYSKSETGKSSATHEGVKQWHYFINDILFQEYGEKETTPYRVTINVKERSDGDYVYSFSAERQNERSSTRRTLHADVNQTAKGGEANAQPSIDSIRQTVADSQEKSSDKVQSSMRDSAGRELTEAQQAYFKDSKVRDADGNLLVMYHQTDGTFTVFDTKHKGAGAGDDETPFGIFLKRTPRNIGVRGEKQMELYADIRNPLRVRDRTELVSKLRELSVDYARLKDESAQIDKEYGAKFEEAKNAFKSFLIQWRKNNPDAPPRAAYDADGFDAAFNAEDNVVKEWTRAKDELALRAKTSITQALRDNGYDGVILVIFKDHTIVPIITQALRDNGYDGVILENDKGSWGRSTDAYIALDANQVKNTTNKTPTADPDIRYQQRDNLKEEYHLTDDEESAIISYKSGDSYTLNGKLTARAELTEYQRKLRDNLDAALEKLPVYRGEVYRHYNFDDFGGFEAMADFLNLFRKGMVANQRGYLSCSTVSNEDRTGGKYTVNMVIQSDNGRRLAGFGRNTENEILLPRDTKLVPYRMERMGPTSIRVYVREETISDAGKTNDSALSGVRGMRKGTQRSENLRQVSGGNPGKVQSEVGRSAGRNGDRGGMPGLREGEGSASLDATGVEENHRGYETRGGEGEGVKNQQREPRLSDRDVLRMAADMAQRDRSQRWSVDDLNRFDLLQRKLLQLDEANAELEALKEERKVLLAGRKVKELTREEQFDLAQNRNRTETQKGKMFVNRIQRVARNNIS